MYNMISLFVCLYNAAVNNQIGARHNNKSKPPMPSGFSDMHSTESHSHPSDKQQSVGDIHYLNGVLGTELDSFSMQLQFNIIFIFIFLYSFIY